MMKTNNFKLCAVFGVTVLMAACSTGRDEPRSSARAMQASPTPHHAAEQSSQTDQSIRAVDFTNFIFPYVDELGDPKQSFTLQRGEYVGGDDEVRLSMRSIIYGDVTGDAAEEAIIVLSVGVDGGTARPHVVYIYTLQQEQSKLLQAFSTGDRGDGGLRHAYAEDGELVVELYGRSRVIGKESTSIEDQTGVCCPKFFTRAHYKWQNGSFQQQGEGEILPNPEGHGSPVIIRTLHPAKGR